MHPLAVYALARWLGLPPLETRAVVLLASLPVGANVYLMAREFGALPGPVAASLVLSTVARRGDDADRAGADGGAAAHVARRNPVALGMAGEIRERTGGDDGEGQERRQLSQPQGTHGTEDAVSAGAPAAFGGGAARRTEDQGEPERAVDPAIGAQARPEREAASPRLR